MTNLAQRNFTMLKFHAVFHFCHVVVVVFICLIFFGWGGEGSDIPWVVATSGLLLYNPSGDMMSNLGRTNHHFSFL